MAMRIAMLLHKSVEFDSRVRREASALAAAGHDVTVFELAEASGGPALLDGFRRASVSPSGGLAAGRSSPSRVWTALRLVAAVVSAGPDVVHAHDAAMLLPGAVAARLTRAQLVYDSHELATGVAYHERGWIALVTAIERAIVPRCAAVITVSDGIADRLRERYRLGARPTVLRNVTALQVRGAGGLRHALGLTDAVPLVLHQGAPAPQRGCELLIDAAAELPDVHVVFLGDAAPRFGAELADRIRTRELSHRVSLLPGVPLDALLAHTAEADVGVSLLQGSCENHRLALPNKLFEYIAAGVAVVASRLPEVERLVAAHGVGWCVAPGDSHALAAALRVALDARDDPQLRARLARAGAQLSWSREQSRLLHLYAALERETLAGRAHARGRPRRGVTGGGGATLGRRGDRRARAARAPR